ncbi:MAG: hypothetical protein ABFD62_13305 [Syntrophaceae bacterium]
MKGNSFLKSGVLGACLLLLVLTETAGAQSFPPIAAPLVRQGVFAVSLATSLGINIGLSETAAINNLSAIGIIPRGGWVPGALVTPAVIGELQHSVFLAARSGQLLISSGRVLTRFNDVRLRLGLPIFPVPAASRAAFLNAGAIDPRQINRFFAINGPPLLTFFPPPNRFRNLFTFTPCPFVCSNVFFPGFFVRNDSRFFVRVSDFGRTTARLVAVDNARRFNSVRFSTDALITARLRSPNFSTTFRWPSGFDTASSIRADNARLFNSVRFSTDGALVRGFTNVVPRVNHARLSGAPVFPTRFIGAPRPFARAGAAGRGRSAARRR